ncbi:rhodanese-like domain-containing protein [Vibrio hangzhouensis]|uniref:rhodanese-like domain-containing protein n=1 Tax=Vibrio hangzhouensis TaxID=462991 RepID=UPI001C940F50|nr:rhodanese-like domain-containing protein [Vibrio hangzhouensis]MBY6198934.1 rhodanese-like domain-containing protein [Vibrio hangzhouensis]
MNEQFLIVVGLLAAIFLYKRWKANRASSALKQLSRDEIQLVDVRSEAEYAGINAPGSINIPVQSLMAGNLIGLDKSKTLVVYCASGMRSGSACLWLKKQGYTVLNAGTVGNVIQHLPE